MRVFLTAEWRDLAVLTYRIDRAVLQPYLPAGLRLDEWQGETLVSLVGFRFLRTRILRCPVPFWDSFPEVNLRFYVCRDTPEGLRRGVVFIKEFVPYYPVATIARVLYNENYHRAAMGCRAVAALRADYRWTVAGSENRLSVRAKGGARMPDEDSLETFILDHHWGYSRPRRGGCIEYEVDRVPWRTYPVAGFTLEIDGEGLYGAEFAAALRRTPLSVVLAEGSPVKVSFGQRISCPRA